jgi:hypothetical protein
MREELKGARSKMGAVQTARGVFAIFIAVLLLGLPYSAQADQVSESAKGVVRVIAITMDYGEPSIGTGSGFAISSSQIVTNAHVVEDVYNATGRSGIGVVLSQGGKLRRARIIAYNRPKDLAVLSVEDVELRPLPVFDGVFREGSAVVALGYPAIVDNLSDKDFWEPAPAKQSGGRFSNIESVGGKETLLHDAEIAHGNSGGPLVDACGRVVGINTQITINTKGNAGFGSAVSVNELSAFLSAEGIKIRTVNDECVPPEVAASRAAAAEAKAELEAEREKAKADRERDRLAAEKATAAQMTIQTQRENYMAGAALALVLAALAAAYALAQKGKEEPNHATKAGAAAAILFAVSAGAFLMRPSFGSAPSLVNEVSAPSEKAADAKEGAVEAKSSEAAAPEDAKRTAYLCQIDEGRSRIVESLGGDVNLTYAADGCVNNRAQYAPSGNGAWQRVSVQNQEDVITRLTFDPDARTFTQERWRPDPDTMDQARKLRKGFPDRKCVTDPQLVEDQSEAQRKIIATMTENPMERLVYQCEKS